MKGLILFLIVVLFLGCSNEPVAVGGAGWVQKGGWEVTDGHVNTVNSFSVQLHGNNVTDYYQNYLSFNTNRIKYSVIAANAQTHGTILVRLYDRQGNLILDDSSNLSENITTESKLTLSAIPYKVEVEFINFTGAILMEIISY